MRTRPCRHCQTIPVRSRGLLSGLAITISKLFVAITSMLGSQFIRFMNGTLPSEITVPRQLFNRSMLQRERSSTRNTFEHFRVRREFFHEHQKTLNGFLRFVTGEAAANEIDLFQFPRLQQEFFAARSGQKDVNGRINSLIANFSVQDHFHVAGTFELLKDQLVIRLPVSIRAVATMVSEPASSVFRAAAKILRGISMARASMPPLMVRPPRPLALLKARAVRVMESSRINTCFPASTSRLARSIANCEMRV